MSLLWQLGIFTDLSVLTGWILGKILERRHKSVLGDLEWSSHLCGSPIHTGTQSCRNWSNREGKHWIRWDPCKNYLSWFWLLNSPLLIWLIDCCKWCLLALHSLANNLSGILYFAWVLSLRDGGVLGGMHAKMLTPSILLLLIHFFDLYQYSCIFRYLCTISYSLQEFVTEQSHSLWACNPICTNFEQYL